MATHDDGLAILDEVGAVEASIDNYLAEADARTLAALEEKTFKTPVHEAASKLPTENLVFVFNSFHPLSLKERTAEIQIVLDAAWTELEAREVLTWGEEGDDQILFLNGVEVDRC